MSVSTLDIQSIVPHNRHPLVFALFESTVPGGSIVLVNNHDPMPLYRQLQNHYPGAFAWNYLEQGPAVWRVEIKKEASEEQETGGCCGGCGCG